MATSQQPGEFVPEFGAHTAEKRAGGESVLAKLSELMFVEVVRRYLEAMPPGQAGCGMAALSYGDAETAREAVQHNLRILAELAREGFPILCSEPTAALMLRHDYPDLVDDPDAKLVAEHTIELTAYLWDLHQQGKLRTDFRPLALTLGHHVP